MKWIENVIRKVSYLLLRILLRNKKVTLPLDGTKIKKILILRYDVLGDMIVTTPVFHLLQEKLPETEIHVLGSRRNIGLLAHDKRITTVWCFDGTWKSLLSLRYTMRNEQYDCVLALVFDNTTKAGLWANWVAGNKAIKIAWANPRKAHYYTALFNAQLPSYPNTKTMSEIQVEFVSNCYGWEYKEEDVELGIQLSSHNIEYAHRIYERYTTTKKIIINISARESRSLPDEELRALIEGLLDFHPSIQIFISATAGDVLRAEYLATVNLSRVSIFPYSDDILHLCALVAQSDALISPDTAMIHIAATYDIPLVGLYPNSQKICKEWGPQHAKFILVVPEGDQEVRTISSEKIITAFGELQSRYRIV